jgi:signal-transduction protein with cAMP-binding, CBS, and nucleotidyltransferase domain
VLRLCILNHSTSQAEVDRALELAATLPVDVGGGATPVQVSYPAVEAGWLGRSALDVEGLRSLPLFNSLDDRRAERVLNLSHEHQAAAGELVVEQWQVSRELYVVLDGAVAVTVDGRLRGALGEGDFFGEIAAMEWSAGFARTRTATVTATVPTRLLVLDWTLVDELMKSESGFRALLESTSRDRLAAV